MADLLFKLHEVPGDVAHEVRELLAEHGFVTYGTHAGFWGLGVSAIWLRDDEQLSDARAVLAQYHRLRTQQQRQQAFQGERRTVMGQLFAHPLRLIAMVLSTVVVLLVTLVPFLMLMV